MTAAYLESFFDDPQGVIAHANECIPEEVEVLVGTGLSGAMVVPLLAVSTGRKFIIVRKDDDQSTHSFDRIEGSLNNRPWCFVDDLVSSGKTRERVREKMAEKWPSAPSLYRGVYLYVYEKGFYARGTRQAGG